SNFIGGIFMSDIVKEGTLLWEPSTSFKNQTNIAHYMKWLKTNINYHLITIVNFGIGLLLILLNFGSHFGNTFIYSIQNPIVLYFLIIKCQEQNGLQVLNSILLNIFFET